MPIVRPLDSHTKAEEFKVDFGFVSNMAVQKVVCQYHAEAMGNPGFDLG
jgi:hypothetical protein